jgi:hypothetical protein
MFLFLFNAFESISGNLLARYFILTKIFKNESEAAQLLSIYWFAYTTGKKLN